MHGGTRQPATPFGGTSMGSDSTFRMADQFKSLLIFNIRHNYYRLIVKVDYRARLLMVKEFLTHRQYTRGDWKKWSR
jgi:mRNA-degrading endonuclease HigB of HigAB toxin-antitoxin module